jgi:MFS family permease
MKSYIANIRAFDSDIRRFLMYNLFANVGYGVFQLVFNLYLLKLEMHEDDIGALSAVQTVCMGIGGLSLGFLVNRLGSWRCVAWGFAVFLVASTGIAFAETPLPLFALSALYGIGLAFLFNTTMPFLIEWSNRRQRAQATAVSFSLISLSIMIGSLVGGLLPDILASAFPTIEDASIGAYRWTLVAGTIIAAIGAIPLWMMTEARTGRPQISESIVAEPVTAEERKQVRLDVTVFILVGAIMSLGVGMVIPFYNVFLVSLGASARQVGFIFAISSAVAAVIGLGAPAMSRRLGALNTVFVLRAIAIPFFLLLIPFPTMALGIAAFMVRQSGFSMAWPVDSIFIGELLPPRARASVFGLRSAAWNLCSALAAFIAGKIIVRTGYDWTFVSIAGFTGLSALAFTLYYRRHPLVSADRIPSALSHGRERDRNRTETGRASGLDGFPVEGT